MGRNDFVIRQLGYPELEIALEWAARENWNPGLNDGKSFFRADPEGFLGGFINGVTIATISAVRYLPDFAFVGFYIVEPGFRGRGFGRKIWDAALSRLEGRTIGLDGVIEQQEFYRRSGFALAHRNVRYQGRSAGGSGLETGMAKASELDFARVRDFDKRFFLYERSSFLKSWINPEHGLTYASLVDGAINGYGTIRPCREGFKLGPLFADDPRVAERLFQTLTSSLPEGSRFFLDIPEPNEEALTLVKRHAMTPVFETARMYKGRAPELPIAGIFGITTFELG
jgi:GNAT superfamily N-acetyltransferase